MTTSLSLRNMTHEQLAQFVSRQLDIFIPDERPSSLPIIRKHLVQSLDRLRTCINAIRLWKVDEFDYLHSSQYCTFLYFLGNTIWQETGLTETPTKLFILNKCLNSIDLFYEIEMPQIFFIGHSVGIVLAKATYSDYLAIYQNSTVGKNHGVSPVIESGVVMYPNTAIIGRSHVKANSVISQGVSIINMDTPGNCLAFQGKGEGSSVIFKNSGRNISLDIFR